MFEVIRLGRDCFCTSGNSSPELAVRRSPEVRMTPVYACVFGLGLAARRGPGGIATVVTALAPRAEPASDRAHSATFLRPSYSCVARLHDEREIRT